MPWLFSRPVPLNPEVICVSIPADADAFHRLLQTHWALDLWTNTGTAEDAQRTQMPRDPPTGPWSVTVLGGADSFWFGGMQSLAEAARAVSTNHLV